MIKQLAYILVLSLLFSCKNETAEPDATGNAPQPDSISPQQDTSTPDALNSAVYIYNDAVDIPVKATEIPQDITLVELTSVINKYNGDGKVKLDYVKSSRDTVYVKIDDSAYLTQQMGTLGSRAYMSAATYTLTEKAGINYVNFDFEEGDHAAPGTYSRESFKNE